MNSAWKEDFQRSAIHVGFLVESEVIRTLIFNALVTLISVHLSDIAPAQPNLAR